MFKLSKIIRILSIFLLLLIFALFLRSFNSSNPISTNNKNGKSSVNYEKAEVLQVESETVTTNDKIGGVKYGSQKLKIEILTGEHKGTIKTIQNYLSESHNIYAKAGMKIIVDIETANPNAYEVTVYSYYRAPIQLAFVIIFFAALCIIGGKKGFKSVLGLLFTFINIIFLFIPMLYRGYSPIYAAILIIILISCVSLLLLDGFSPKTLSAILGTILGVVIAAIIAIFVGDLAHLSGFNTTDSEALIMIAHSSSMQVKGLLLAAILVASLGAVMDLSMSIASSVQEIYISNPRLTIKELFNSGMNVGKDMMGTMANTLILAFTGASLNMLILIYSYNVSFNQLMNMDMVNIEILQGLTGSLAVILTVPIIAGISSILIPKLLKKNTK